MRQRKIKNLETKLEAYNDIIIWDPLSMKGRWDELAGGKPIYLEIGCGKGKFISELAAREPDNFFVAVEGNQSVLLRALEKVRRGGLTNVCFAPIFVEDLTDWFADEEVTGIYLNFSDPLPKNYWYRRRLTYRERLKTYFRVLKDDGIVWGYDMQYLMTGQLNQHPRTAIQFTKDKRRDYAEFYNEISQ